MIKMKSILNFFGIPEEYSKKIIVNKKNVLFEKKILKFQLTKELKSSLIKEWDILFFKVYKNSDDLGSKRKVLAYFSDGKEKFPAIVQNNKKIIFFFDPEETISFLLNEEYLKKKRPAYTYLPFHYHKIFFRFILVKLMNLLKPKPKIKFPKWPIEKSVEAIRFSFLESLKKVSKIKRIKPFWPQNKKYALVLTHDVDTRKGLDNITRLSSLEEKYSLNSTWFLVSNYYPLDEKLLKKLKEKKHEIACHGYIHDNKLAYLSKEEILFRLKQSLVSLKDYGIKGFRSPSLITSPRLNQELSKFFSYDSSTADVEIFPVDSNISGCCTVFPFIKNNLVEIPITIPMDCSLIFLGYSPKEILKIWIEKLKYIKKLGGAAILNTHPEPAFSANKQMLQIYYRFLDFIAKDKDAWITNMSELAFWWKKRELPFKIYKI